MTAWLRADTVASLRRATLVLDLDGVVVDVRATYRLSYLQGIAWHLQHDLGLPWRGRTLAPLRAVHTLKRHAGFNAPAEVVALLLRLSLIAAWRVQGQVLDARQIDATNWIQDGLRDRRLDRWREVTWAALDGPGRAWLEGVEAPERALAVCRETYVGSVHTQALFGHAPVRRVAGLWRHDRLLLDPRRPPPDRPVAVYTGRTTAEARWLLQRFRWFDEVTALETVDTGAYKPDGLPLQRLRGEADRPLLYIGDLTADRQALQDARRRWPEQTWLLGQIAPPGQERWSDADIVATDINALLDALGA
jgi:phosphoglycolate phosphatase-like HAD superfamily hydrolase